MTRIIRFSFLIALLLSGCNAYVVRSPADEDSAYYSLPVGTVLVLHREVAIAPGYARVYFQNGQAAPATNEFEPHCWLEVRQVLPVLQIIRPDEFVITKVAYDTTHVAAVFGLKLAGGGGGGVSDLIKIWTMRLRSEKQPDVLRLVCGGGLNAPALARTPSATQIRAAFGSYASLRLP